MLISVITPAYNEEKNIYTCYANLCKQSFKNFEWLVVDDGSTDNTLSILKDIISNHNTDLFNIKLLEQKNSGAAIARKFALENASGDFICRLDFDDYLSSDSLYSAVNKISDNIDIVEFNIEYADQNGNIVKKFEYTVDTWPIDGKTAFSKCIDGWGLTGLGIVRTELYKKAYSLHQGLDNTNNNINDDDLITRYSMYCARQVDSCEGIYYYVKNLESTTQKVNKNYHKVVNTAITLDKFIKESNSENKEWSIKSQANLLAICGSILGRYIQWYNSIDNHQEWRQSLYNICNRIYLIPYITNSAGIIQNRSIWHLTKCVLKVNFVRAMEYIYK